MTGQPLGYRPIPSWIEPTARWVAAVGAVGAVAASTALGDDGPVLCPFRLATGGYCPGCGLSRAANALLRGDVATSLSHHPYLPLLLLQGLLIGALVAFGSVSVGHRLWNSLLPLTLVNGGLLLALWIGRLATGAIPAPFAG